MINPVVYVCDETKPTVKASRIPSGIGYVVPLSREAPSARNGLAKKCYLVPLHNMVESIEGGRFLCI